MNKLWLQKQNSICKKYKVTPYQIADGSRLGISLNVREELFPLNGMRIYPETNTNGWYIWAGQSYSEDEDFFSPLHIDHIEKWCPKVVPYLLLPPGWRFLIAPNFEDVWFDKNLLQN